MASKNNGNNSGTGSKNIVKFLFERYFVKAMSAMALGLFSSLIIGTIIGQIARIPYLDNVPAIKDFLNAVTTLLSAKGATVGAAIGGAIAYGLGAKPLVIFTSIAAGALGVASGGGPVGAYLAAVVATEVGGLVAGKTKIDIVITPFVTIISGGLVGYFVSPYINDFMSWLGSIIGNATLLNPFLMGVIVSVIVGLALTAPISSAALCIMLWGGGDMTQGAMLAAGAAAVGCSAQMIGFAVASFRDNGVGGLLSQGLGTSMLQIGNIMKKPQILIAPTLAGAILGPVSTCILKMTNTATGAGMGTSGLVGQIGAIEAMGSDPVILLKIAVMHFIAPALIVLAIDALLRKIGWIKNGDMKLDV